MTRNDDLLKLLEAVDKIAKHSNDTVYVKAASEELLADIFYECIKQGSKAFLSIKNGTPMYTIEVGQRNYTASLSEINERIMREESSEDEVIAESDRFLTGVPDICEEMKNITNAESEHCSPVAKDQEIKIEDEDDAPVDYREEVDSKVTGKCTEKSNQLPDETVSEIAMLDALGASLMDEDAILSDEYEDQPSMTAMPTDNLTAEELASKRDCVTEVVEPKAGDDKEEADTTAYPQNQSEAKDDKQDISNEAEQSEKEEKKQGKYRALDIENTDKPFKHPNDRGEIFKHTHKLTVTMKYNLKAVIGKFKVEFWPTWVQFGSNAQTYADCLVRISSESGEENLAIIDRSNKEFSYKFSGTEFTFKMVGVWNSGMLTTHVSIDNDAKYHLEDEFIREEPQKLDRNYLEQFKYVVKGQPRYFIVPLRSDNRGEAKIPITGIVEDEGAKYILARMDGNCCRYTHNNRTRVITGHWEDGKFKISVI